MKIGIISDTHMGKDASKLEEIIEKYFSQVELIIHAGDYKSREVIYVLESYKKFIGVWGNVDNDLVKGLVSEKEILELCGYRLGIFHGHGEKGSTIDRAYSRFINDKVDIIVFGHSHQPIIKTKKKILMLNPGSLTSKRKERWFSYIILELEKERVNARLFFQQNMI